MRHGRYVVFQMAEVAASAASVRSRRRISVNRARGTAAAVLGMRIESDERRRPDR
jgi:hypothetical protein